MTSPKQNIARTSILSFSRPEAALMGITIIWGATFLVIRIAMQFSGPLFFVGLRFMTAGFISALLFHRQLTGLSRTELLAGCSIGAGLFLGYSLQTWGLQTISSSQSAFITALYVPFVPLLQWLVFRQTPGRHQTIGILLAFTGLVMLGNPGRVSLSFSAGEWATLVGAIAVAAEIILISHYAGRVNLQRVTTLQLLVAGLLAFVCMPLAGEVLPQFSWVWLAAGTGLGAASCLIQLTMNWAQRQVSANRATVIYASEPVWAGLIGRTAGERQPAMALLGAALIVLGVIVGGRRQRHDP